MPPFRKEWKISGAEREEHNHNSLFTDFSQLLFPLPTSCTPAGRRGDCFHA